MKNKFNKATSKYEMAKHVAGKSESFTRGYQMQKLTDFESAQYHGFTVKRGFWYGKNLRGQAVVATGRTCNGCIAMFVRRESGWFFQWHDANAWYLPDDMLHEFDHVVVEEISENAAGSWNVTITRSISEEQETYLFENREEALEFIRTLKRGDQK